MNRLLWCDNLKAFAVALVVLGHCRLIQEMRQLSKHRCFYWVDLLHYG